MAKRIFSDGNYLVVDQDNGNDLIYFPKNSSAIKDKGGQYILTANIVGIGESSESFDKTDLTNWYAEDGTTAYSSATFLTLITDNTAFNQAGASALPTGWATLVDTQYPDSGNALTLTADTDHECPNNAGSSITSQLPSYVNGSVTTTANNGTYDHQKIDGRNGDGIDVMLYFKAVPSSVNQWLDIWIDIGGSVGELYRQTFTFPKGSGTERGILYALSSAYTLGTWEANGGTVYLRSNASIDIYKINMNIDINHKAR